MTFRRMPWRHRVVMNTPTVIFQHPFQLATAITSVLIGLTLLLSDAGASATGLVFAPHWGVKAWQVMMLVGGPLTIWGLSWRGEVSIGMAVERAGLYLLACAWSTRGVVLVLTVPTANGIAIAVPLYATVATACLVRAAVIQRTLKIAVRESTYRAGVRR